MSTTRKSSAPRPSRSRSMSWLRIVIGIDASMSTAQLMSTWPRISQCTSRDRHRGARRHAQRERQRQHVAVRGAPRTLAHEEAVPHVALRGAALVVLDELDGDRRDGLVVGRRELDEALDVRTVEERVLAQREQQHAVVVRALVAVGEVLRHRGRCCWPAAAVQRRPAGARRSARGARVASAAPSRSDHRRSPRSRRAARGRARSAVQGAARPGRVRGASHRPTCRSPTRGRG